MLRGEAFFRQSNVNRQSSIVKRQPPRKWWEVTHAFTPHVFTFQHQRITDAQESRVIPKEQSDEL